MHGLSGCLVLSAALLASTGWAQESSKPAAAPGEKAAAAAEGRKGDAEKESNPVPAEKTAVTHHEMSLHGKTLKYTATAGTLLIRDEEDKPYGSIFYVAYTLDGAETKARPVSFLYNGGPGSASVWLHMGSFGPVRVGTDSPKPTPGPPFTLTANDETLLDKTDLVFIDAPLTGFSRAVGKATVKDFAGVDQDLKAFDRFISRYLTVSQRWNSPKYLMGESYGTTRSAALADMLAEDGVQLNGVVLISSILNYNVRAGGYDTIYVVNLPSYAAAAWYFDKVQNKPKKLSDWVDEARKFAAGPYAEALFAGQNLSGEKRQSVAKEMSRLTGLSVDYLLEANLRVSPTRFRKELLRDARHTMGRYDMRFEGVDVDAAGEFPGYDASSTGITGAYVAAFRDYLSRELKFESTENYRLHADTIRQWDWKHRPTSGGFGEGGEQSQPYVAADLAAAIRKNPSMKVFSANGYFDLATPFFSTEYDVAHMNLEPNLRGNVQFGYYPSGHMIYLNVEALKQLTADLDKFIAETTK